MLTHLPLPGSLAIDGVSCSDFPAYDEHGVHRPIGAGADIGAVEAGALLLKQFLPLIER